MRAKKRQAAASARPRFDVHIRWMIRRDMPEVLDIEDATNGGWSEEDFLRVLRQRNAIGMVCEGLKEHREKVLAFMIYELHKERLEVMTMRVHPEFQRRDVGTQMVEKLVSKLSSHRRFEIRTTIPETNLGAAMFLRAMRFLAVELRRGEFDGGDVDGYVMSYEIEMEGVPLPANA